MVEWPSISGTTLGFTSKLIISVANAWRLSCNLDSSAAFLTIFLQVWLTVLGSKGDPSNGQIPSQWLQGQFLMRKYMLKRWALMP